MSQHPKRIDIEAGAETDGGKADIGGFVAASVGLSKIRSGGRFGATGGNEVSAIEAWDHRIAVMEFLKPRCVDKRIGHPLPHVADHIEQTKGRSALWTGPHKRRPMGRSPEIGLVGGALLA